MSSLCGPPRFPILAPVYSQLDLDGSGCLDSTELARLRGELPSVIHWGLTGNAPVGLPIANAAAFLKTLPPAERVGIWRWLPSHLRYEVSKTLTQGDALPDVLDVPQLAAEIAGQKSVESQADYGKVAYEFLRSFPDAERKEITKALESIDAEYAIAIRSYEEGLLRRMANTDRMIADVIAALAIPISGREFALTPEEEGVAFAKSDKGGYALSVMHSFKARLFAALYALRDRDVLDNHIELAEAAASFLRHTRIPCTVRIGQNSAQVIILPRSQGESFENDPWLVKMASALHRNKPHAFELLFDTYTFLTQSASTTPDAVALHWLDLYSERSKTLSTHELRHYHQWQLLSAAGQNRQRSETPSLLMLRLYPASAFCDSGNNADKALTQTLSEQYARGYTEGEIDAHFFEMRTYFQAAKRFQAIEKEIRGYLAMRGGYILAKLYLRGTRRIDAALRKTLLTLADQGDWNGVLIKLQQTSLGSTQLAQERGKRARIFLATTLEMLNKAVSALKAGDSQISWRGRNGDELGIRFSNGMEISIDYDMFKQRQALLGKSDLHLQVPHISLEDWITVLTSEINLLQSQEKQFDDAIGTLSKIPYYCRKFSTTVENF